MPPSSPQEAPIGVFDSGVGGLTVTRALVQHLPHESFLYLGDTARVPYGNKSADTIQRYSLNVVQRLVLEGVKAVVVACNTASAHALPLLQASFPLPIIGVIEPVSLLAARTTRSKHIAIIGTRATIASQAYPQALLRLDPSLHLLTAPCPLFVPLAEEGWTHGPVPSQVAHTYLAAFDHSPIDTLILGCTHYPLLRDTLLAVLQERLPQPVNVLDSASATAEHLLDHLRSLNLLRPPSSAPPSHRCLFTDSPASVAQVASRFFGAPLALIEHVDL